MNPYLHLAADSVLFLNGSLTADTLSKCPEACFAGCLQQRSGHDPRGTEKAALRSAGDAALGSDAAQCRLGSFWGPGTNRLGSDLHRY
jgi:hypothetical protein